MTVFRQLPSGLTISEDGDTLNWEGVNYTRQSKEEAAAKAQQKEEERPFSFHREHDGSLPLSVAVFQALGAASMCWSETPKGVFDSTRAKEIGDALLEFLGQPQTNPYAGQPVSGAYAAVTGHQPPLVTVRDAQPGEHYQCSDPDCACHDPVCAHLLQQRDNASGGWRCISCGQIVDNSAAMETDNVQRYNPETD